MQLNANLTTLMVSTYLGGTEDDMGYGVRVSDNGDFYVCGSTRSANFPTTAGAYQSAYIEGDDDAWNVPTDAFVAVLTWDGGTLNASTYLGTEETDQAFFLDTDTENNIWIYGHCGVDMPVVGAGYLDSGSRQFIANLPPSLDVLLRSTTIGTSDAYSTDFIPIAFLVDACDNIYISSHSSGSGLEVTGDALYDTGGFYLGAFTLMPKPWSSAPTTRQITWMEVPAALTKTAPFIKACAAAATSPPRPARGPKISLPVGTSACSRLTST